MNDTVLKVVAFTSYRRAYVEYSGSILLLRAIRLQAKTYASSLSANIKIPVYSAAPIILYTPYAIPFIYTNAPFHCPYSP